jgi:hypothetical protein
MVWTAPAWHFVQRTTAPKWLSLEQPFEAVPAAGRVYQFVICHDGWARSRKARFQVHCIDVLGCDVVAKAIGRNKMLEFFASMRFARRVLRPLGRRIIGRAT